MDGARPRFVPERRAAGLEHLRSNSNLKNVRDQPKVRVAIGSEGDVPELAGRTVMREGAWLDQPID
jgi:hypothetical protein